MVKSQCGGKRGYSLSSPRLTCKAIPRGEGKLEALRHLRLNEDGCTLVTLVRVLLVYGSVVLLRVVAAFHDAVDELS